MIFLRLLLVRVMDFFTFYILLKISEFLKVFERVFGLGWIGAIV